MIFYTIKIIFSYSRRLNIFLVYTNVFRYQDFLQKLLFFSLLACQNCHCCLLVCLILKRNRELYTSDYLYIQTAILVQFYTSFNFIFNKKSDSGEICRLLILYYKPWTMLTQTCAECVCKVQWLHCGKLHVHSPWFL